MTSSWSPGLRQAIIWTNAEILSIRSIGTNFNEIVIEIHTFSFQKIRLKMSSGKWRPFRLGLNTLNLPRSMQYLSVYVHCPLQQRLSLTHRILLKRIPLSTFLHQTSWALQHIWTPLLTRGFKSLYKTVNVFENVLLKMCLKSEFLVVQFVFRWRRNSVCVDLYSQCLPRENSLCWIRASLSDRGPTLWCSSRFSLQPMLTLWI